MSGEVGGGVPVQWGPSLYMGGRGKGHVGPAPWKERHD